MTDKECIEHLERLKFGIKILNNFCSDDDKDNIDIETIDYAISRLKGTNNVRRNIRPTGMAVSVM